MAGQGWIQLHRKILASDIWPHDRPYTDNELFIYLMLQANHKNNYTDWYGKRELVRRGQHLTSILKLGEITHRDRGWIRRRLLEFEQMGMIKVEICNNRFTLITICNYDTYNTRRDQDATTDTTTDTTQTTMINNDNKYSGKPEKVERKRKSSPEYQRKNKHIIEIIKSELDCGCSPAQAGVILNTAGKDRIGDVIVAVHKSKGQIEEGGDCIGMVIRQLQERRLWTDIDHSQAKALTTRFNEETIEKQGIIVPIPRR